VKRPTPFFEEKTELTIRERNLPHWQQGEKYYFVTWQLADSLPANLVRDLKLESEAWLAARNQPLSPEDEQEFHELFSDRLESLLDDGRGSCILSKPDVFRIVEQSLRHFDGSRYSLSAFVLMPNHVHVLFKLAEGEDLGKIIHSWKSF
jgi:hypothetical protein